MERTTLEKARKDREISVIDDKQLRKMIRQEVVAYLNEQREEIAESLGQLLKDKVMGE